MHAKVHKPRQSWANAGKGAQMNAKRWEFVQAKMHKWMHKCAKGHERAKKHEKVQNGKVCKIPSKCMKTHASRWEQAKTFEITQKCPKALENDQESAKVMKCIQKRAIASERAQIYRPNAGKTLAKCWQNASKMQAKCKQNAGEMEVKCKWNAGEMQAKPWQNASKTQICESQCIFSYAGNEMGTSNERAS
jgi:hypothetical protein